MVKSLDELSLKLSCDDIELFFNPDLESRDTLLILKGMDYLNTSVHMEVPGSRSFKADVFFMHGAFPNRVLSLKCEVSWLGVYRVNSWELTSLKFVDYRDLPEKAKLNYLALTNAKNKAKEEALKALGFKLTAADIEVFFNDNFALRDRLLELLGITYLDVLIQDRMKKGPKEAKLYFFSSQFPNQVISLECTVNSIESDPYNSFEVRSWRPPSLKFEDLKDLHENTYGKLSKEFILKHSFSKEKGLPERVFDLEKEVSDLKNIVSGLRTDVMFLKKAEEINRHYI